jgi:hypothetical protein
MSVPIIGMDATGRYYHVLSCAEIQVKQGSAEELEIATCFAFFAMRTLRKFKKRSLVNLMYHLLFRGKGETA